MWTANDQKYTTASELVKQLIAVDVEIIKKIRAFQPTISLIDKDLIMRINSNVPERLANDLTKRF